MREKAAALQYHNFPLGNAIQTCGQTSHLSHHVCMVSGSPVVTGYDVTHTSDWYKIVRTRRSGSKLSTSVSACISSKCKMFALLFSLLCLRWAIDSNAEEVMFLNDTEECTR